MVKTVSWAQEAKKFYEENKGKNGIHSFSDALKSPALKKQYKLAKKGGDPTSDGQAINYNNNQGSEVADESSSMIASDGSQYDGGNDDVAPESAVMDGGNENELTPSMDGGKRKKSARRTKKSKKSKTVKKQRKHKK
jgi:hypothetical protein